MSGIMMPMLKYRFRILLDRNIDPEYIVTQNVVSYEADYKNKKINLVIRQPASDSGMTSIIRTICDIQRFVLTVEALGPGTKDPEVQFLNELWCSVETHNFKLSYGNDDNIAHHYLTMSFDSLRTKLFD